MSVPHTKLTLVRRLIDPKTQEDHRWLAVQRILEGESPASAAAFLEVTDRSVRAWQKWYRDEGEDGLKLPSHHCTEFKLTVPMERQVCDWLTKDAITFGFRTNFCTSPLSSDSYASGSSKPGLRGHYLPCLHHRLS